MPRSIRGFGAAVCCVATLCASSVIGQVPVKPKVDTSATRIKISKDKTVEVSRGEVVITPMGTARAMINLDSIERAHAAVVRMREDSARIIQGITDSIIWAAVLRERDRAAAAKLIRELESMRATAAARADSTARAERLALQRRTARGFYFGLGGGASVPQRAIRNGYTGGWNVTVPVGWDAVASPLGVRADFAMDHVNGTRLHDRLATTVGASGDVTVWSLNLGMKMRMHPPGAPTRTHVYAIGGLGAHRVSNGVYGATGASAGTNLDFADAKTRLGWNVGAGAAFGWGPGRAELFMETRFVDVKSDMGYHMDGGIGTYTSFTPIIIGVQFF